MKKEDKIELENERIEDATLQDGAEEPTEETQEPEEVQNQEEQTPGIDELKARIAELEDKNLRMMAEFDNYRRRTNKEKLDLMATAGERIFKEMLPLVDDFERALENLNPSLSSAEGEKEHSEAVVNGVKLIYNKFISFLDKEGVHAIETNGVDFNTDEHEAITTFAAGEDNKGKVIDCTQKGYKLGDKVIRFAKVVVGE